MIVCELLEVAISSPAKDVIESERRSQSSTDPSSFSFLENPWSAHWMTQ